MYRIYATRCCGTGDSDSDSDSGGSAVPDHSDHSDSGTLSSISISEPETTNSYCLMVDKHIHISMFLVLLSAAFTPVPYMCQSLQCSYLDTCGYQYCNNESYSA